MIRAIIADDERPAIERLKKMLKIYSDLDLVGEAQDGLSTLTLVAEKKPDILFLDIDMPELTGIEVAKTLGVEGPLVIFVTAYDDQALAAFESNAIDYLVKPIDSARLAFTVEKLRKSLANDRSSALKAALPRLQIPQAQRLAVKIGSKYEVFDPSSVSIVLARDHYTSLMIDGRELLTDDSLEAILNRLDASIFVRVHRSAALNIRYLKELKREGDRKYIAILSDKSQSQVQVSRERLPLLKQFLGLD